MPALPPDVTGELDGLLTFLTHQFDALLAASYGLTDEQARSVPTAGALSVSGLLKHVCSVHAGWVDRVLAAPGPPEEDRRPMAERRAEYGADFVPGPDESVEALRERVSRTAGGIREQLGGVDLDERVPAPEAPWFSGIDGWSVRWVLLHLIQETARHAGHADIVRESIDGATCYELIAAAEGWPATPWLTPWSPAA